MISVYQIKKDEVKNLYPDTPFNYGIGKFDPIANLSKYELVADLDVETLDEAYEVGNIGPENKITRYKAMHSVSVGDILLDGNVVSIVSNFGFDYLLGS
tara:strand:- start:1150 stop:1446 length:297 start_codon:yes stop_codon:yes gene_type:complete